jgi:serine/threonine-protein kinase HipA
MKINMISDRAIYVHVQLPGTLDPVPAARLRVEKLDDGTRIGHFRYGDRYLERPDRIELDPFRLPLSRETFRFTKLKGIPGAVRDAGPDYWGRLVIERILGRSPNDLDDLDYLLQAPPDSGGYLSFSLAIQLDAPAHPHNRTHQLAELIAVAAAVQDGRPVPPEILERLVPGTSLGGARPKASVEHEYALWLAKFPEREDRVNVQRIEHATLELARRAGLDASNTRLERVGGDDVLMVRRFDREWNGVGYLRHGLVSGLTVLDADDGYVDRERWSYLLLADELRRWSYRSQRDLHELFRRMVFNACIGNTDDHPRNHALLRQAAGWRLAPAYDLVPQAAIARERRDLALAVGQYGRAASLYNILSACGRFGLSTQDARATFDAVVAIVRTWREVFRELGVSNCDIETTESAFLYDGLFADTPVQAPPA